MKVFYYFNGNSEDIHLYYSLPYKEIKIDYLDISKKKVLKRFKSYDLIYFTDNLIGKNLMYDLYEIFKNIRHNNLVNDIKYSYLEHKRHMFFDFIKEKMFLLDYKFFNDIEKAKEFLRKTDKLYVIKPFKGSGYHLTYVPKESNEEVIKVLEVNKDVYKNGFILQEKKEGLEVAFSFWLYKGKKIMPTYINFEFKRSITDEIGSNTGQSADFGYYTDEDYLDGILNLFKDYTGYLDINGIINDGKYYPLEITISRDGYPTIGTMLYKENYLEFLECLLTGKEMKIKERFKSSYILRIDKTGKKIEERKEFKVKVNPDNFIPNELENLKENIYKVYDYDNLGLVLYSGNSIDIPSLEDYEVPDMLIRPNFKDDLMERWGEWNKWKKKTLFLR